VVDLPLISGNWDDPQPCTAPQPDSVDAVAALNMLRDRIPQLILVLQQVHADLPKMLVDILAGDTHQQRWQALAELCQEPGEILTGLARVCRDQGDRC
jgi:hypothetical protein